MGHFARVVDGVVVEVIVAEQDYIDTLPSDEKWVQTSYNLDHGIYHPPGAVPTRMSDTAPEGRNRRNYAGPGMIYDSDLDMFYSPKPEEYPSFVLNRLKGIWEPPVPRPVAIARQGFYWDWDEEDQEWFEEYDFVPLSLEGYSIDSDDPDGRF